MPRAEKNSVAIARDSVLQAVAPGAAFKTGDFRYRNCGGAMVERHGTHQVSITSTLRSVVFGKISNIVSSIRLFYGMTW